MKRYRSLFSTVVRLIPFTLLWVPSAGANLIPDSGFESGTSAYLWGGSTVEGASPNTGAFAAALREDSQWGGGYERTITGLTPGATYIFSAYVKTVGGRAAIGVKDHGSGQVTESFQSTTYQQVEVAFTMGDRATSATCFVFNAPGGASLVWIDDLSLVPDGLPPGSPLQPLPALPRATGEYELVFSDEFNTEGSFDRAKWKPEVGFKRNNEAQYYQAENVAQTGGNLVITARRERVRNANYQPGSSDWRKSREFAWWTSGSIRTVDSFRFLYGRIVCRAKVTNLPGTWPAIWTVGGGEWPATGEIDIMENYGGKILANFATAGSGRWNASWDAVRVPVSSFPPGWVDEFHIWELVWEPDSIEILLNGVTLNTFNPATTNSSSSYAHPGIAPFRTFGQFLWLNLAIGGDNGGNPSGLPDETVYLVDYIRVYQRKHPGISARIKPLNDSDLQVDFQSIIGRRYSVLESNDLSRWTERTNIKAAGSVTSHAENGALHEPGKFFRVEADNSQLIDPDTP